MKQLTAVAGGNRIEGTRLRAKTRAMEGAMLRKDLLNRNVPRLEHDRRAREARRRLERVAQLFGKRPVAVRLRSLLFVRMFGRGAPTTGWDGDTSVGSSSDRRPHIAPAFLLARAIEIPI